jgi:hypothetical protein
VHGAGSDYAGKIHEGEFKNDVANGLGRVVYPQRNIDACIIEMGKSKCVRSREGVFRDGRLVDGRAQLANGEVSVIGDYRKADVFRAQTSPKASDGAGTKRAAPKEITLGQAIGVFNAVFGNPFEGGFRSGGGSSSGGSSSGGWACRAESSEFINGLRNPYGKSFGYATEAEAKERALQECRANGGKNCLIALASCGRQ